MVASLTASTMNPASAKNANELDARRDDLSLAMDLIEQDQALRTRIDMNLAAVKSHSDLNALLQSKDGRVAVLQRLTPRDRKAFLSSLKFNERGLTEFDIAVLRSLSPSDVYKVLGLFGLQGGSGKISESLGETDTDTLIDTLPKMQAGFLLDFRCADRGTCSFETSKACTSNC